MFLTQIVNHMNIPLKNIDWSTIEPIKQNGMTGYSIIKTLEFEGLKIRLIEYSEGYMADHWCQKGHFVHCLEGEFSNDQENGNCFSINQGMSFIVSDNKSSHRLATANGCKVLIVDGEFLTE